MSVSGWIGVDLDGTLAHYETWGAEDHIGEPIPRMLARVKKWLADGVDVRIFTARASYPNPVGRAAIEAWCQKHVGKVLPITNAKDLTMIELWDDRAVQVEMNTGRRIGE